MKLIKKDDLVRYLHTQKETLYRISEQLNIDICNASCDLESNLAQQSQISYGIDIIMGLLDKLEKPELNIAELDDNGNIIFYLSPENEFSSYYEYLSSQGVSAIALFNGSTENLDMEGKKHIMRHLVELLRGIQKSR